LSLTIPDSVYPYLRVQKGEINHIEDFASFKEAYNQGLKELFDLILPWVPAGLKTSLDIGSGMGGIDILLQKHFNHHVFLLDALETPPICEKHDKPFNSYQTTEGFFYANGIDPDFLDYVPAKNAMHPETISIFKSKKMDLILSVGSYCFHYSPLEYLNLVKAACHKETILIFDVRNRHTDWLEILRDNFTEVAVLLESEKFTKRVFKIK